MATLSDGGPQTPVIFKKWNIKKYYHVLYVIHSIEFKDLAGDSYMFYDKLLGLSFGCNLALTLP